MQLRKLLRVIALAALPFALLFAISCSGGAGGDGDGDEPGDGNGEQPAEEQTIPDSTIEVDTSLTPYIEELPGFDSQPRPVAAVVDADGVQAEFIENELLLMTDDSDQLDAFLDRWSGEVIHEIDPGGIELDQVPPMYLVRVDTSEADTETLPDHLRQLHDDRRNDLRVSSEAGHRLLAAGAAEAADGLQIGVAWVGRSHTLIDRTTTEASGGLEMKDGYGSTNAFDWPTHALESGSEIGTAEAWRLLAIADRLDNEVRLAILDQGYHGTAGLSPEIDYEANAPFIDPFRKAMDKAGHGAMVTRAAMGLVDDGYGGAGSAGPIADGLNIYTSYDFVTSITALVQARRNGAKIANMSYGIPVPAVLGWTVRPFNITTRRLRSKGMLLFASAGNEDDNIEAKRCLGPFKKVCWEKRWHTPCENNGVICVGGLAFNSRVKDMDSNFGGEHLDIWAPFSVWVGATKDDTTPDANLVFGTSFASPYTAGVAALIWAAQPRLGAQQVVDILYDTATGTPLDTDVDRIVNAYGAVKRAIGNLPPHAVITSPADGATYSSGSESVPLEVRIEDHEGDVDTVTWGSDRDGQIGTGRTTSVSDLSVGTHQITVNVRDAEDQFTQDSVTIEVTNDPPQVELTSPEPGENFYQSQTIPLRATTYDPNTLESLPDRNVQWYVGDDRLVGQGHSTSLPPGTLTVGNHRVEVVASDGELRSQDAIGIDILQDPEDNVAPTALVSSPDDGESFFADQHDDSVDKDYALVPVCGHGVDPEDGTLEGSDVFWYYRVKGDSVWQIIGEDTGPMSCPNAKLFLESPQGTDYELRMEVTDSEGATDEAIVEVTIRTLI